MFIHVAVVVGLPCEHIVLFIFMMGHWAIFIFVIMKNVAMNICVQVSVKLLAVGLLHHGAHPHPTSLNNPMVYF